MYRNLPADCGTLSGDTETFLRIAGRYQGDTETFLRIGGRNQGDT